MFGRIDPLDIVQDVSLGDKKIFPSIIIEVFKAYAPPGARR